VSVALISGQTPVSGTVPVFTVPPGLCNVSFYAAGTVPCYLGVSAGGYYVGWASGADYSAEFRGVSG